MKRLNRRPLVVEQLEDRTCPSLAVTFLSGNLTVSGAPLGTLTLQETAPNRLQVTDTGVNLGTYAVTGNLTLNLTNHANGNVIINLTPAGGTPQSIPGNVSIDLGLGDPTGTRAVRISGGRIGGNLSIQRGSGLEHIDLGQNVGAGPGVPLTIGGSASINLKISPTANLSAGDVLIVHSATRIGGNLNTTNVDNIFLVKPTGGDAGSSVGGNLSASNAQENLGAFVTIDGLVGGNLSVTGSRSDDAITVDPTGTIRGNVSANLGEGFNSFALLAGATVFGDVNLSAGAEDDTVTLSGAVGGSVSMNLGDGANVLAFNAGATVAGNLGLTAGNGPNDLTTFAGSVAGNVALNLGNGDNTFTFAGSVGGSLSYTAGNGNNSVTIGGANGFALTVRLGSGSNTFTYAAGTTVGSALIDFGVGSHGDAYIDNGVVVTWPQTIENLNP
jgi:fibronectin-binding autotransporter adhesin